MGTDAGAFVLEDDRATMVGPTLESETRLRSRSTHSPGSRTALPLPIGDLAVADLMTPGVVTIAETASLRQGLRALATHRAGAVLVVGSKTSRALRWITDRGLLSQLGTDAARTVRNAITEAPMSVTPGTRAAGD